MKKIIPFTKDIKFNTKIYEISSISLENTLVVEEDNQIDGEFIISGDYKINDSSINTEPFIYSLPFDIDLDSIYDMDKLKVDIDDFKYEIINEQVLKIKIDVLIEGEEKEDIINEITPDVIIEERKNEKEEVKEEKEEIEEESAEMRKEENLFEEVDENIKEVSKEENIKATSIFENFDKTDEKYVSYYVHIVRENDNLDSIASKYNINIDEIKKYNNIDQITLGNKIIIPYINNETI